MIKYCHTLPMINLNFHNLLSLDFAFFDKKIAFNFHSMDDSPPKEEEPTPLQKLRGKIMSYEDWEVFELNERYFETLTFQERVDLVTDWAKVAKQK